MLKKILFSLFAFSTICSPSAIAAIEKYASPISVVSSLDGKTIYAAEATGQNVSFIDVQTDNILKSTAVSSQVSGIAISPDGEELFVTSGIYDGIVSVINIKSASVVETIDVGHNPIAPVVSSNGKVLYVCSRFQDKVLAIDLASKKIAAEIPVVREPVAADITSDGKKLIVANFLPAGRVDLDFVASAVTIIDTASNSVIENILLPNGSIDLRGVTVSPDNKYAYVTHILARYQLPTTQLERGWMNTNAMTIIDVAANKLLTTVLLDDVDLGAANPYGLACTDDGKYLCVANSGTHQVIVIDRIALHEKIDKVAKGEKVTGVSSTLEDVPNDLSFLVGIRRRIDLKGNGPRNMTLIGTKAYIAEYFSDSIGVVEIDPDIKAEVKSIKLTPDTEMSIARKGEMFFHDASLCFQKWQSCATCHPGDARPDALNWDLMNDGVGNPKNTKSLLLSHQTPPSMITGIRDSAEIAVRAGIKYIQFAVRPEEDAAAIDEYLKGLKPLPSPYLEKDASGKLTLSDSAKRGKKLFDTAGCAYCHSGPYYTDKTTYNVGLGIGRDKTTQFDTPTLIEIWRTSPYLYDGRAATIKEVLTTFNQDDTHGRTSNLSEREINDLQEYILSL